MVSQASRSTYQRVQRRLEAAFLEEHTNGEVALSFSIGLFITALPTLGTGFIAIAILVLVFERLSKIAMLAAVIVLNPVVKWGVYASSFWLGQRLLGPVTDVSFDMSLLEAGPDVLVRLWIGNVVLAVVLALIGYVVALWLVFDMRQRFDGFSVR